MSSAELHGQVVNWSDIEWEQVRPGVRRRVYVTDDVMLVMNELDPRTMKTAPHVHEQFDQLVSILSGRAVLNVDEDALEVGAGDMVLIQAGSPHFIEPLEGANDVVLNVDVFSPPREDMTPGRISRKER